MKSNCATRIHFGSISCFVIGVCLSNNNLYSFLIHQASYSKGYQWYLMLREGLGSIRKLCRYPIKMSEVLYMTFHQYRPLYGYRQTVQTQIRQRVMRFLIKIFTDCSQNIPKTIRKKLKVASTTDNSSIHEILLPIGIM